MDGGCTQTIGCVADDGFAVDGGAERAAHMHIVKGRLAIVEAQIVDADPVDEQELVSQRFIGDQAFGFAGGQAAGTHHINLTIQVSRKQGAGVVDDQDFDTVNVTGAAQVVRPGGLLVYATCSLELEENEDQVDAFLRRQAEFTRSGPPSDIEPDMLVNGSLTLLPHRHGMDGAFAVRLRRTP